MEEDEKNVDDRWMWVVEENFVEVGENFVCVGAARPKGEEEVGLDRGVGEDSVGFFSKKDLEESPVEGGVLCDVGCVVPLEGGGELCDALRFVEEVVCEGFQRLASQGRATMRR